MKMPEKHDLLGRHSRGKENKHQGNPLRFAMAYLRGRYNGGAFTKTVIDATCAPLSPGSFVAFSFRRTK